MIDALLKQQRLRSGPHTGEKRSRREDICPDGKAVELSRDEAGNLIRERGGTVSGSVENRLRGCR